MNLKKAQDLHRRKLLQKLKKKTKVTTGYRMLFEIQKQ